MLSLGKLQSIFYNDRVDAGNHLARVLRPLIEAEINVGIQYEVLIVAIPRSGVIIGDAIASSIGTKLDIVVTRKIASPENPEFAIGAVMPDGNYFLNDVLDAFNLSKYYVERQAKAQFNEIQRRLISYRGTTDYDKEFEHKIIILVDDGIATGATLMASAQWIKSSFNLRKLIAAVPVAPQKILDDLKHFADEVVVPISPHPFIAVGRFYGIFDQVSDNEVKKIMKKYGYNPRDKVG
jgi:putative phosphoribosyl transferase